MLGQGVVLHLFCRPSWERLVRQIFKKAKLLNTYRSKNNFHKIEKSRPWSPLHKILVPSPRPNSPRIPSSRITNLAASAIPSQWKLSKREKGGCYHNQLWHHWLDDMSSLPVGSWRWNPKQRTQWSRWKRDGEATRVLGVSLVREWFQRESCTTKFSVRIFITDSEEGDEHTVANQG